MTITPATLKLRFPEVATVSDDRLQLFIDDAALVLNESFWGTKYDLGLSYLTMHYYTVATKEADGQAGSVAGVSARSVDGSSLSYNVSTGGNQSDTFYSSTSYGQRYLVLLRTLGVGAYVV